MKQRINNETKQREVYHDNEHTKFDISKAVCLEAHQGDVIVFDG